MPTTGERFERAVSIMARLRAPGGCPWDREQTFDTIKPYTLEETYEVLEAIDARDWNELTGELGDLLLQVLFYAEMADEEKHFTIDDVLDRLSNKLIDRHPHVFGDVKADTPGEVVRNWQALKAEEKKKRQADSGEAASKHGHPDSVLHGVSSAMPSLMEAYKISTRVAHVGFDWPNIEGLFDKLNEETAELRQQSRGVSRARTATAICRRRRQRSRRDGLPRNCAAASKTKLATCCLCWSISRGILRLIRSRRCARRTASSVGALNIWKIGFANRDASPPMPRSTRWKSLWQESKQQEKL